MFLRETDQKSYVLSARPEQKGDSFWLRLIKRGKLYEYSFSADGDRYAVVGEKRWGNGAPKSLGVFAKNGGNPLAGEIDAQFDFFEVRSLTEEERNQPDYVARRALQGAWDVIAFEQNGTEVENLGPSQGGRAANQYELPLAWNGLLPLVADLCQQLNDVRG